MTRDMMTAYAVGAIGGSRSMLAPALVAPPAMRTWLALLAAGEMVADKTAQIPARTKALPLIGRAVMGGLAGLRIAPRANRITAAAMGAAGAVSAAYALYHLRRIATTRCGVPNVAAGLAEDALALGAGAMLLNRRAR